MCNWFDSGSDTQTGKFPANQASLEHVARLLPAGGGHDRRARRAPHSPAYPAGRPGAWKDRRGPPPAGRCRAGSPGVPDDVVYGFGWMDESGRVPTGP